jgi:hypothetical protein
MFARYYRARHVAAAIMALLEELINQRRSPIQRRSAKASRHLSTRSVKVLITTTSR